MLRIIHQNLLHQGKRVLSKIHQSLIHQGNRVLSKRNQSLLHQGMRVLRKIHQSLPYQGKKVLRKIHQSLLQKKVVLRMRQTEPVKITFSHTITYSNMFFFTSPCFITCTFFCIQICFVGVTICLTSSVSLVLKTTFFRRRL